MWETITASFKERMEAIATIVFAHGVVRITLCQVRGHTNVAAQDQDISRVCVVKVQVTKFQVHVRC
jgi:broad specificity phosphatase PhoE